MNARIDSVQQYTFCKLGDKYWGRLRSQTEGLEIRDHARSGFFAFAQSTSDDRTGRWYCTRLEGNEIAEDKNRAAEDPPPASQPATNTPLTKFAGVQNTACA